MGPLGVAVIVGRWRRCRGLELVEQAVEVDLVEDQAAALAHGHEPRAPLFVEGAALDADVLDGFGVRQTSFHGLILLNSTAQTKGLASHEPPPLMASHSDL